MKKLLKWIAVAFGILIVLVIAAAVALSMIGSARLNKKSDFQPQAITVPTDSAALDRGEHLVRAVCTSCHGEDLSGSPLLEDPAIGTLYASNITGLGETRSDADLVLAIRHGIGANGRRLMIMPSESFINFSAEDLGAIIAYLKRVPPVKNDLPEPQISMMGRILLAAGMFGQVFPAEYIDHDQPFPAMPAVGANVNYGKYLSGMCMSCHGSDLSGGQGADPDSPPPPSLTQGGRLTNWTESGFLDAMRTGVTPEGRSIDPEYMPWESFGKLADEELRALWMYLSSLSE